MVDDIKEVEARANDMLMSLSDQMNALRVHAANREADLLAQLRAARREVEVLKKEIAEPIANPAGAANGHDTSSEAHASA